MSATTVSNNTSKISSKILRDRIKGGLYGIFIADALSMPVHWYYDVDDIKEDFGQITTYQAPKKRHPSSIMNLSNTSGGGRGYSSSAKNEVVGGVILHDKRKFWGVPQTHYHQGMKAGENTLNALCARVAMRSVIDNGLKYEPKKFLEHYIKFMTTPGSHNDTYAESYHRDFFANYAKGLAPEQCCGEETHNTPSVGGFVTLPPVLYASILEQVRKQEHAHQQSAEKKEDIEVEITEEMRKQAVQTTLAHLALTHKGKTIASYARVYCNIMLDVLLGKNLRKSIEDNGKSDLKLDFKQLYERNYLDTEIAGNKFTIACYIDGSLPIVLYLAYKYQDNFDKAIIANTNVGGENCHRGSALGALLGTYLSISAISEQKWIKPLVHYGQIEQEVKDFLQ